MRLSEILDRAVKAGLVCCLGHLHRQWAVKSSNDRLRRIRKDPGDLARCVAEEDLDDLLKSFAIAETMTGRGPGWIPVVQKLAFEIFERRGK